MTGGWRARVRGYSTYVGIVVDVCLLLGCLLPALSLIMTPHLSVLSFGMTRFHHQLLYVTALAAALLSVDALSISSRDKKCVSSRRNFVQFGLVAASTVPLAANAVDAQFKEVGQQVRD